MYLVLRLISVTFCYKDGGMDKTKLTQDQKDRMQVEKPSVLEMFSYAFFCQGCLIGPFLEFSDYKRFIERTGEFKSIPSPIVPSLIFFGYSFLYLGVFVVGDMFFPIETCWSMKYYEFSFPYKVFYYWIALIIKRFFYYSPFTLADAGLVACGFGYNGTILEKDKPVDKWDRSVGMYVYNIETMKTPLIGMRDWNHMVHIWIKHYIAGRLVEPGQKMGLKQTMIVFFTMSYWHGFQPSIYIVFFYGAILVEMAKDLYRARYLFRATPEWA